MVDQISQKLTAHKGLNRKKFLITEAQSYALRSLCTKYSPKMFTQAFDFSVFGNLFRRTN